MKTLVRSLAIGVSLLTIGFAAGINVGGARAQLSPPQPSASSDKPAGKDGINMDALEKAVHRAAKSAFAEASAEALDRIQKAAVPPEVTALHHKIKELDTLRGELDTLRGEVKTELLQAGNKALEYALWGLAGFFGLMVLASVVGGAIVAAMFGGRRRA